MRHFRTRELLQVFTSLGVSYVFKKYFQTGKWFISYCTLIHTQLDKIHNYILRQVDEVKGSCTSKRIHITNKL